MSDWFDWILSWSPFSSTTHSAPAFEEPSDTASFAALAGREAPASEADSVEFAAADRTDPESEVFPSEPPSARLVRPARPLEFPRSSSFQFPIVEFSRDFEVQILSTREPDQLAYLVPSFLDFYLQDPSIQSLDPDWCPAARVGRALRAGISARRVLTGQFHRQAQAPTLPGIANQVYVCLRCIRSETGWWTTSYDLYWGFIADPDTDEERFQAGSVSHSFPTCIEAEVFLRGAYRQWPRELQSRTDL